MLGLEGCMTIDYITIVVHSFGAIDSYTSEMGIDYFHKQGYRLECGGWFEKTCLRPLLF